MNQRLNFLALILIDALDDENEEDICNILDKNMVDPSFVPIERGIAPLHFSCGMENADLSNKITKRFLESGANPNVRTDENMTPLHIAAMHGRVDIVKMLLEHNAQLDITDDERKTPVHYAIEECHFEVVQVMRDHIFQNKFKAKQKQRSKVLQCKQNISQDSLSKSKFENYLQKKICNQKTSTPNTEQGCQNSPDKANKNTLGVTNEMLENIKYTPNRLHYNYDVTSPYYINITHRRHQLQPKFPALDLPPEESDDKRKQTETPEINSADKSCVLDGSLRAEERPINIFALTRENVEELSQTAPDNSRSRISLIEAWRQKVLNTKARQTILKEYDDINEMIDNVMANDHLNFTNVVYKEKSAKTTDENSGACGSITSSNLRGVQKGDSNERVPQRKIPNISLGTLIQRVAEAQTAKLNALPDTESSYQTVPELVPNKQNNLEVPSAKPEDLGNSSMSFIRSPKSDFYLQMKEAYVHTDDENGLVFYETKLPSNPGNKVAQQRGSAIRKPFELNRTTTTQSTSMTLPLDYETDELRAELTTFGEVPGPITKTTKRLYIKRLVKYKRNPELMKELREKQSSHDQKFSVELYRTVRREDEFAHIADYLKYEADAMSYFASGEKKRDMREGHLKQSFIYMLIDPCISCNLPGESVYLEKFDVWKRFLHSIFYVGKGKTSRPYSHLYDAMKAHSQLHPSKGKPSENKTGRKQNLNIDLLKSPPTKFSHNKKLDRILKIWGSGSGVVCLNVFHNILPIEAYTREAAIIDALSLKHLTNIKRGDYYGPSKNWPMKEKKHLGIALLYKSMLIYLAEGESQLAPSDLI